MLNRNIGDIRAVQRRPTHRAVHGIPQLNTRHHQPGRSPQALRQFSCVNRRGPV